MYSVSNKPDMIPVLTTLTDLLQTQAATTDRFLRQMEGQRVIDPFQYHGDHPTGDPLPDDLWKKSGMHRLVLDPIHYLPMPATLATLVGSSSIIEFADWAAMESAPGYWDRLYIEVIKPIDRRSLEFIFHLGDISAKPVFEIDEVLDIIGDYSSRGKVTLMLDNLEADSLWRRLNGRDATTHTSVSGMPPPGQRYGSLFNTMRIASLVVLYPSLAVHFSRAGLFDVGTHAPSSLSGSGNDRRRFSIGYQLGILFRLEVQYCTALGLALSGLRPGPISAVPRSSSILEFMQDWLRSLYSHTA